MASVELRKVVKLDNLIENILRSDVYKCFEFLSALKASSKSTNESKLRRFDANTVKIFAFPINSQTGRQNAFQSRR